MVKELYIVDLGVRNYQEVLELQEQAVAARAEGKIPDTLFLLEHYPVFTLGTLARKKGDEDDDTRHKRIFKVPRETLSGTEVIDVGRGGHVTYHCPGQIVGYPIIELEQGNLNCYITGLEEIMISASRDFGVETFRKGEEFDPRVGRIEKFRGVWYRDGERECKLGAIGLQLKKGSGRHVTMHGFSYNVNPDLTPFEWINPCGLEIDVASLSGILGNDVPMEKVKTAVRTYFTRVFGYQTEGKTEAEFMELIG